ncbi:hydroxyacid dehydrogenase [Tundrisphaera lichenicola]|uniref:hydroxyacid dehydrogenase n=1 Tax=Tundrisphaera lichenicola TaxID=2029860 RepID=UPI003EC095A3
MADRPIILSLTTMNESGMDLLRQAGELRMASSLEPSVLHREIVDADALVIRTAGTIDAALMDCGKNLRVIGRHGVGYDQVDIPAATERGILVVYTPGANTQGVAEHVFAMMIGVSKRFPGQMRALAEGRYNDRTKLVGRDIAGKTLGIVGLGRIGRRVASIAYHGFGMNVLYNDVIEIPFEVEDQAKAVRVGLGELLGASDYVTLHVPLDASTRRMINRESLAKIKPGAVLINTCRGPVVEEAAVLEGLESGRLFGYGADVYTVEPPPSDHPLIGRIDLNMMLTPHSAAQSVESLRNMAMEVATDVVGVLEGRPPINPVNNPAEVAEIRRRLGKPPLAS